MEDQGDGEPKLEFDSLKNHATEYFKNRLHFIKLTVVEYIARLAPAFVFIFIISLFFLVFWIFINVSAAISIGKEIQNLSMGFLIVSGINIFIAILVYAARKAIIFKPVSNWLVKLLLKSTEEDENK